MVIMENTAEKIKAEGNDLTVVDIDPDRYVPIPQDTEFKKKEKNEENKPINKEEVNVPSENSIQKMPKFSGHDYYYGPEVMYKTVPPNGINVGVEFRDLWMDIPNQKNYDKLMKELEKLESQKNTTYYYDSGREELEQKIEFLTNKIKIMSYHLDKDEENVEEEINKVLNDGMKRVPTIKNIEEFRLKEKEEKENNRKFEEAESVKEILGEKYID